MQLALFIDQVAVHRGVTDFAAMLVHQQLGFGFIIFVDIDRFITRGEIDGLLAALFWRQGIA